MTEVETVISELKSASRRRDEESRRTGDEVRGLKDLIPRAMEGQKEAADNRLKELASEMKSMKILMEQRMNPPSVAAPYMKYPAMITKTPDPIKSQYLNRPGDSPAGNVTPRPASVSASSGTEAVASLQSRSDSPFNTGVPTGGAKIPAWQMAAANKSPSSIPPTSSISTTSNTNGTPEASGSA